MTVRRFSAEEKRTIVLAYLSGVRMADLCREHQVTSPTVYAWRDRFLEGGVRTLEGNTPSKREASLERENARLRDLVAELTLANDVLKKGPRGNGGGWR
jgi:transposase-like protein